MNVLTLKQMSLAAQLNRTNEIMRDKILSNRNSVPEE